MKKTFIVANWKSNKTELEAKNWLFAMSSFKDQDLSNKEIIVCPSFVNLSTMKTFIAEQKLPIKLGAQDISPFDEGSYTGEVNGKQIKEFAEFVIIGHSERRKNFFEKDEILFKKAELAMQYGLIPIFCMQNKTAKVPKNIEIVAYDPTFAIGTDNPDTPENVNVIAAHLKANSQVANVLYGGSVTAVNVNNFTRMSNVDGVLVGRASLDVQEFIKIVQNA